MGRRIVQDSVIPAGYGQAFEVRKGQVLRIHAVEDGQVGDCCFFNANDYKEWFHVGQTWVLNVVRKTGNGQYYTYFYSKPPRENLMFTVLEDTVKRHFAVAARGSTSSVTASPNIAAVRETSKRRWRLTASLATTSATSSTSSWTWTCTRTATSSSRPRP